MFFVLRFALANRKSCTIASFKAYFSPFDLLIKMGRLSEAIFGKKKLPERCLIYAGAYSPKRKEWVKSLFDKWQRVRGYWVRYSFASKESMEYLLIFNVYGAAMTLEIIQLLKDGQTKKVFCWFFGRQRSACRNVSFTYQNN